MSRHRELQGNEVEKLSPAVSESAVEGFELSEAELAQTVSAEAAQFDDSLDPETVLAEATSGLSVSVERQKSLAESFDLVGKLNKLKRGVVRVAQTALALLPGRGNQAPLAKNELYWPPDAMFRAERAPSNKRLTAKKEVAKAVRYMREGMARMETAVIDFVRQEPDAPREAIMEVVDRYATQYGLKNAESSTYYYTQIEQSVNAYLAKHAAVERIRNEVKNDHDLYFTLFGAVPKGRVKVLTGPMTLHVRCDNIEDYARIYFQRFQEGTEPTKAEITVADVSGGCSIPTALQPELAGCITAEKALGSAFESRNTTLSKEIYLHEEQHAMKRLYEGIWSTGVTRANTWREALKHNAAGDAVSAEASLRIYFRFMRGDGDIEKRAADEIAAYMAGIAGSAIKPYMPGKSLMHERESEGVIKFPYYSDVGIDDATQSVLNRLMKTSAEGGLYDYTAKTREQLLKILVNDFKINEIKAEQLIESGLRGEYKKLIAKGLSAFVRLLDGGYKLQDVLSRLNHVPLHRWSKAARQALKQKTERHPIIKSKK